MIPDRLSEEFVRLICGSLYEGRFTSGVRERFTPLVRNAFRELQRDIVQARLSTALASAGADDDEPPEDEIEPVEDVITTEEELEGYMIVKAIVRNVISPSRIVMRDQKSYCGILVDDNNRKPLIRLHFNGKAKAVGVFDSDKEERVRVESLDDLYALSDRLRATAEKYTE